MCRGPGQHRLSIERENLAQASAERGAILLERLTAFQSKSRLLGEVRGKGLMIGLELVEDAQKTPAAAEAKEVRHLCREQGVLVGLGGVLGNVVRLQPPLVLTADEAEKIADVVEASLVAVAPAA